MNRRDEERGVRIGMARTGNEGQEGVRADARDGRASGPLNIHAAQMNRTDSPEYSTVYGDDKNYSTPGKNRISAPVRGTFSIYRCDFLMS